MQAVLKKKVGWGGGGLNPLGLTYVGPKTIEKKGFVNFPDRVGVSLYMTNLSDKQAKTKNANKQKIRPKGGCFNPCNTPCICAWR